MKSYLKSSICAGILAMISCAALASPNLVVNGGFENGSNGWEASSGMGFASSPSNAHSGNEVAFTGCVGHGCVSTLGSGIFLKQTVNTTADARYDLTFWVGENSTHDSEFSVFWDGNLVADVLNPANFTLPTPNYAGMVQFTFHDLIASSAGTAFEIHGRQDPGQIYFDDVSVSEAANDLPEPASLAIVSLGLAGLAATRRRQK